MKKLIVPILTIILFTTISCSSCKKNITDPNGLPAATQSGTKTLGFLLNGQPWTPQGFNGFSNLSLDLDFGFKHGIFGVSAYKIISTTNTQSFSIGISDSLNFMEIPIVLPINNNTLAGVSFSTDTCYYLNTNIGVLSSGSLTITKLDKTNRIVSGMFNAILYKPGCDTIKITDGRFDMPY